MHRIIFYILTLSFLTLGQTNAQKLRHVIYGGVNTSSFSYYFNGRIEPSSYSFSTLGWGFSGGYGIEYSLPKILSLSLALEYLQTTGIHVKETSPTGNPPTYAIIKNTISTANIMIPLLLKLRIIPRYNIYLLGGISMGKIVNISRHERIEIFEQYKSQPINVCENRTKSDFNEPVYFYYIGIGRKFNIGTKKFISELYYFKDLKKIWIGGDCGYRPNPMPFIIKRNGVNLKLGMYFGRNKN